MGVNKNPGFNLYDFVEFPNREMRDEARRFCDIDKMRLTRIRNENSFAYSVLLEQYSVWISHINSFAGKLGLHFFLLYYQYKQNPLETMELTKGQTEKRIHKVLFDTFAEDVSVYLISYFDKHLEMYNDIYNLQHKSGKKHKLSRKSVIREMEKCDQLKDISRQYQNIEQSKGFTEINQIRNSIVHNKALSYYGSDVCCERYTDSNFEYSFYVREGIRTNETYEAICQLIKCYEEICVQTNTFINEIVEDANQEECIPYT